MIEIINGEYDKDYFNKMLHYELKLYFKQFLNYEDFVKREKIPYIKKDTFMDWFITINFMDINIFELNSTVSRFLKKTINNISYDYDKVKILMSNYQRYETFEIDRISKEFSILTQEFNNKVY